MSVGHVFQCAKIVPKNVRWEQSGTVNSRPLACRGIEVFHLPNELSGRGWIGFRNVSHESAAAVQIIAPLFGVAWPPKNNSQGTLADY